MDFIPPNFEQLIALITPIFSQMFKDFWYFIPLFIILILLKSPWFKGIFGEFMVNVSAQLLLDNKKYHLIKNITLPTADGSTQIDHIIVSQYGVFVVETKNMKGWIFGSATQKMWTQKIYRRTHKFQNPLHQNYKHTKTLEALLGLNQAQIFSVIVFVGDSTFKTKMPQNVTYGKGYIRFIKSKSRRILSEFEVQNVIENIAQNRLSKSFKTNRTHIKHVKTLLKNKK
jgi:hypothetical protein